MGGAYISVSDDFAAVFYNPAGLPQIGDVDLGFGMNFLNSNFNSINNVVVGETLLLMPSSTVTIFCGILPGPGR